jgi:predicted CXXCH cytochrome family protein
MKGCLLLLFAVLTSLFAVVDAATVEPTGKLHIDPTATWAGHEPIKNCVTCHGEQLTSGKTDLVAAVPALCTNCHKTMRTPAGWVHGPVATGQCLFCHEAHTSVNASLLRKPIPEICYQCHKETTVQGITNHGSAAYAQCMRCHEAHAGPGRMLFTSEFLKTPAGLVFVGEHPSAQPRPQMVNRRDSLKGLAGVKVMPDMDKSGLFKRYGLTGALVKTVAERQLQQRGIAVLSDEQTSSLPVLRVSLRLLEMPSYRRAGQIDALSGSLKVSLQQMVELSATGDDQQPRICLATTWDTGGVVLWGASQVRSGLEEAVKVLVEQFCKAYLTVNPKQGR